MTRIMFQESSAGDICNCFDVSDGAPSPITTAEAFRFINSLGVKCYGSNENGYIVYGK